MKTKNIRIILFVLISVLLFFCGFIHLYNVLPVNKDITPEASVSINESEIEDISYSAENLYDDETLDEVIDIIENGTDIDEFFYGSVLNGITLDNLYEARDQGRTIEDLMDEYTEYFFNPSEKNVNEQEITATTGDADTDDPDASLELSGTTSTSNSAVIKQVTDISSVSMGSSLSALGCNSHGKLHKITIVTSDGTADAFCIDIGKSVHAGNTYSTSATTNSISVYGSIYYWYMNHKSNNAYAAASFVIWAYSAGVSIPTSSSGTAYDKWYSTYMSTAVNALKNDKYLSATTIKTYIASICNAVNNGSSCIITTWKSPLSSNQRLITGNISKIPYNLTFHKIGIDKYGATIDSKLSGAVYGIYKSSSCSSSSLLYKYTTDSNGEFTFSCISSYSTLYIKEITAPKNYNLNTNVYTLVSSTTSMTARDKEIECGRFCILKTDADTGNRVADSATTYADSGRYILYSDKSCTTPAKDIYGNYCIMYTTPSMHNKYWKEWCDDYSSSVGFYNSSTGWLYSGYMPPGTYYLKETHAPDGYSINKDIITVTITATGKYAKDAVVVNSSLTSDTVKEGSLALYKNIDSKSEVTYATVEGAVYYLYAAEDITDYSENTVYKSKEYVDEFPETDENGYAELSDIAPGTYYIVEHEAPDGLYRADEVAKKKLEYNSDGSISSDITIQNASDYGVEVASVSVSSETLNVYDAPIYYGIKIHKYTTDANGNNISLEGAEFMLFDTNLIDTCNTKYNLDLPADNNGYCYDEFKSSDWEKLKDAAVKLKGDDYVLTTDSTGYAEGDKCIPYGTYVLVETQSPLNENNERYLCTADPIVVNIGEQTSSDYMVEYNIYDAPVSYDLALLKVDGYTDEPLSDNTCGFHIYSMDTKTYLYDDAGNDIFYTDETGMLKLTDIITTGTYMVEEAEAPKGYGLSDYKLIFHLYIEDNQTYLTLYDSEKDAYGNPELVDASEIKYISYADIPYSIQVDKVDENNNYVSGAELAIYLADEDGNYITDVDDNKVMLTIDDKMVTWVSEESGYVISKIPAGYYILSELNPPENHLIASDIFFSVGITYEEGEEPKTDNNLTGDGDIITMIDRTCGKVTVYKTGEQLNDYETYESLYGEYYSFIYENLGLANVEYFIYDMDMNLVTTMTTDETGFACSIELETGNYYLKETAAPEGYIIDDSLKAITIYNASDDAYKNNQDTFNLYNEYQEVSIVLTKSGADLFGNLENLANAVFGIYCNDSYSFDDSAILPHSCLGYITTDSNGCGIYTGKLPSGSYYIKEVKAPDGYELSTCSYDFNVSLTNADEVITYYINDNEPIVNYKKQGSLELYKTDSSGDKVLSGAEFTLYDMDDNMIAVMITDENGYASLDVDYGSYYLKETTAPDGYILDSTVHFVEVNDEMTTITLRLINDSRIKLGVNEWWYTVLGIAALLIIISFASIIFLKRK